MQIVCVCVCVCVCVTHSPAHPVFPPHPALPFPACLSGCCSNVLGMLMGWGSNWLVRTPLPLRYHVVAASGFGNLNSLPLLIVFAVCKHDDLPFYQGEQRHHAGLCIHLCTGDHRAAPCVCHLAWD